MTLTQILQKIRNVFYTKKEIDSMGGGTSLSDTISQKADKSDLSNYLPKSGGTVTGRLDLNDEIRYIDTKYDWTDPSLNVWCGSGHTTWFDNTDTRRMHTLVGANGGIWRKVCFINENPYFTVNSNREMWFQGNQLTFNGKNVISSNAAPGVLSFPSTSGINYSSYISSGAGDIRIKAPADGWFKLNAYCQSGTKFRCAIDSINLGVEVMTGASGYHTAMCPIKKDEYVALCVTGTNIICQFFPCEGNV